MKAKVLVVGTFSAASAAVPFTTPEVVPTVKGVFRKLPGVQVETCDTKGDPSAGLICERKAISDQVDAVIDGSGLLSANQALLTKAGIPLVGVSDVTSANSFPVVDTNAEFSAVGIALGQTGCKKLGTLYTDGVAVLADDIKKGVVSQSGQQVATASIAANAPDVTPAVAKITGAGAGCIALVVSPDDAVKAITALKQSGKQLTMAGVSAIFTQQVLNSLGALGNGLLVVDTQLNPLGTDAGIAAVTADMTAEDSSAKLSQTAVITWVAAKLIAAALPAVQGTVTPAALNTALDGLRNVDLDGVVHPWSSIELSNPNFKRTFNHYAITYKVQGSKPAKDGDFFDLAPALAAN